MGEVILLEGLPPNNAAHKLSLVSDERRARAVADLIAESFEPGEAASTAFETEERWPGGGRAWLMEAYFGLEPRRGGGPGADRRGLGRGDRALRDLRPYGEARLGGEFARRPQTGAGRALSRSWRP